MRRGSQDRTLSRVQFGALPAQIHYHDRRRQAVDPGVFEKSMIFYPHDAHCIFYEIFPCHLHVTTNVVPTKNWSQDIWMTRYLGTIVDRSGVSVLKAG